jgi:hypothetical protein
MPSIFDHVLVCARVAAANLRTHFQRNGRILVVVDHDDVAIARVCEAVRRELPPTLLDHPPAQR